MRPNVRTYSALVIAHSRGGDLDRAEQFFNEGSANGHMDAVLCNALLYGYLRRGMHAQRDALLERMRKDAFENTETWNTMLGNLLEVRRVCIVCVCVCV